MEDKFAEFVSFIGIHSMTMSFEFVTTFLGDHGSVCWHMYSHNTMCFVYNVLDVVFDIFYNVFGIVIYLHLM